MARAEAGRRIDDLLDEIAEMQRMIDMRPAVTLEDAAVKLRRLEAYVDRGQPARLLAGALSAVERAALRPRPSLAGLGLSSSDDRFRGWSRRCLSGAVRTVHSHNRKSDQRPL